MNKYKTTNHIHFEQVFQNRDLLSHQQYYKQILRKFTIREKLYTKDTQNQIYQNRKPNLVLMSFTNYVKGTTLLFHTRNGSMV